MEIIYRPKGKAGEYAKLALNIYRGCSHRCSYCYGPGVFRMSPEQYFSDVSPKKDLVDRVRRDCERLIQTGTDVPEILVSFIGDPYCREEMELNLTRSVIKVFIKYGLSFTVLTKGGARAARDFDLLEGYSKARFGTSLVWIDQDLADRWEPGAASVQDRIETIVAAHNRGIRTWVSLEPVIAPNQALGVIRRLHPVVDHWKVGKINYNPKVEETVDWRAFRQNVCDLFNRGNLDFYLKNSLSEM